MVLDGEVWHTSGYALAGADRLTTAGTIRAPYLAMVETGSTSTRRMADLSIDGAMSGEEDGIADLIADRRPPSSSSSP